MAERKKTGGRQKGTPNRITGQLKDMILAALDEAGGTDYLVQQSEENPVAFMTLVGKVLPLQIGGSAESPPIKHELDYSKLSEAALREIAAAS